MRTFWLKNAPLLSVLIIFASAVQAQVAAPRLNSIIPEAPDAFNPATLPWSGPSRVGSQLMYESTKEATVNDVTTTTGEGEGKYNVQGRYVGETFALSAEALKIDSTFPNVSSTMVDEASMVNAAVLLGDMFSIGVGQQNSNHFVDDTDAVILAPVPATWEVDSALLQVGLTAQLFEGFFLGGSAGTDTITHTATTSTGFYASEEQDRSVKRMGVAYFARDGDGGFHLEAYKEIKEFVEFTDADLGIEEEIDTTGVVLEVVFANILLGVESIGSEFSDATSVAWELTDQAFSIGWVPEEGFSVTATVRQAETTYPYSTGVENEESSFVGIAWLF